MTSRPRRGVLAWRAAAFLAFPSFLLGATSLEEAEAMLGRGEYEKAREAVLRYVARDPSDGRARLLAARTFLETGRREEAVGILKPLVAPLAVGQEGPLSARLARAEARFLLAELTGDAELMKSVIQEELPSISREAPGLVRPHVLRIRAFMAAGQKHDAKAETSAAFEKDPRDPDLLMVLGRIEEAVRQAPQRADCRVARALNLLFGREAGSMGGGEEEQAQEGSDYRGDGPGYVASAAARTEALEHLARALEANPRSAAAHAAAAAWHYYDGDLEKFTKSSSAARAINPCCALPELWAARLSENPRDPREAIRWEKKAVAIDPFLKEAWLSLGLHSMNEGDIASATEAFRRVRAMDLFNVTAKNCLTLLEDLPDYFEVSKTEHFELRLSRREAPVLRAYAESLLESWYAELSARYRFQPELPIRVELYDDAQDFAVRGFGTPGVPFLGVCLGRVVVNQSPTTLAPRKRCWAQILRHELTHIFSVQATEGLVAQWFTEGLSTYEERRFRPEWDWEEGIDEEIFDAFHDGTLLPISRLSQGFGGDKVRMYYYVSSLVCEYLDGRFGVEGLSRMMAAWRKGSGAKTRAQEMMRGWTGGRDAAVVHEALGVALSDLDKDFAAWLGKRLAAWKIQPRLSREEVERLAAQAAAAPEDLLLAARLARGCFQNGLLDEAQRNARRVVERGASWRESLDRVKLADACVVLGHMAFDRDEIKKARQYFEEAEKLGVEDFYLFHALGVLTAEEDGRAAEAIRYFEKARAFFPRQVYGGFDPYRKVYDLAKELGDERLMREAVERRIAIVHEDERSRRWLLARHREAGRHAQLLDVGMQLLWIDPFDARTHLAMAEAHRALADPAAALRETEAGLKSLSFLPVYVKMPEEVDAATHDLHCLAAEIHLAAGRRDETRRAVDEALAIRSDSARAGEIRRKLGEEE